MVSEYLRRLSLQALPASQRTLMTLVLRKLLASSTFSIGGARYEGTDRLRTCSFLLTEGSLFYKLAISVPI
jgi:adenine-specific DNA-methyltransferase